MATSARRVGGRTLIDLDPDRLVWILLARESSDREQQVDNQLTDLRAFVSHLGGRVDRQVPENDVSAFKRRRVQLPDGTYGYRVVRPDWEEVLTALRKGECNALAVPDIDRATRDPRTLEDLIDAVELYGVYVTSMTGNIDLTTDAGIDAARSMVNQRNQESRNTSRRVMNGQRHAAMKGKNHGGRLRAFGWRKDRKRLNKREYAHIRRELPRIFAGVSPLTLAQEWKIPTVTGAKWRAATIRNMYLAPRMCGKVIYQGEILMKEDGTPARGEWEPILTDEEYDAVVAAWGPSEQVVTSRLGAHGRGYRTNHLLSPFVRCGVCSARMVGSRRPTRTRAEDEWTEYYRCPGKGQGGCASVTRVAAPIHEYIKALVIAEQQKIQFRQLEALPPWPKAQELAELQGRISEQQRQYEKGKISASRHFESLARMESDEAKLLRESRAYERRRQNRVHKVANLAEEWGKPSFTIEQKQAAIAESLEAIIIMPVGKGGRFHPDQIVPVFKDRDNLTA